MAPTPDFAHLVPDVMLDAVESVLGMRMSGLATPLPSYINRVYEVQTMGGERLIAKFYRPDRWSREAIEEEHAFTLDCVVDEIPVIAPMRLPSGETLHEADGIYFALFEKRLGRQFEIHSRPDWLRVGNLLGRLHVVGSRKEAVHRTNIHPEESTADSINYLLDHELVAPSHRAQFEDLADTILDESAELFDEDDFIRIHGDCHGGNILTRPGEGLCLIDFDDMMMGPAVHDLWLLLPGPVQECRFQVDLLIRGYEQFREFDDTSLRLVEPLRAMRMIYYLAWCGHQVEDYKFRHDHPQWGSDAFWQRENADLDTQLQAIRTSLGHAGSSPRHYDAADTPELPEAPI
ncbi:MAG: serine/threonine protein kinase [Lentisphaerae bacterium]|nr:serine/threonine protein kinase [Lentisphaerota bacterium]